MPLVPSRLSLCAVVLVCAAVLLASPADAKLDGHVASVELLHRPLLAKGAVPTPCVADLTISPGLNHLVVIRAACPLPISNSAVQPATRLPITDNVTGD